MCLKIILKFDSELDKSFYLDALRRCFGARFLTIDAGAQTLRWQVLPPHGACDLLVIENARSANALFSNRIIRWCDRRNKILVLCDSPWEAPPIFDGLRQAIHLQLHGHGIASHSECLVGNGTLRLYPEDFANAIQTMHRVAELYTSGIDSEQLASEKKQVVPNRRTTSRRFEAEESEKNSAPSNRVIEFL